MKNSPISAPTMAKKTKKKFEDYEISSAHDTLLRAKEIEADSKLMECVLKHNHKKKKAICSLDDLRKKRAYNNSIDKIEDEQEMKDGE
jgi:hypothetical protein